MRIAILAYDGCVASGVSGFADVLAVGCALAGQELFTVRVLGRDGKAVRCFSGPSQAVDGGLVAEGWDALYVPPAYGLGAPDPELAAFVGRAHKAGAVASAACAGVFFLAEAGILDGRAATTHWGLAETFAARYPAVRLEPERMLVDGGDYVCAGGLTAYHDLALHLIARFVSPDLAAACARVLLLDPGRARQTPYMSLLGPSAHGDEAVRAGQGWIEERLAQPLRLAELAGAVSLGERTLLRRFRKATGRTPGEYLRAVRVERAKRLLETGEEAAENVAWSVGYGDVSAFFRAFKGLTGLTPREYRERFSLRPVAGPAAHPAAASTRPRQRRRNSAKGDS